MAIIKIIPSKANALRDDYTPWLSYSELNDSVKEIAERFNAPNKSLAFLYAKNRVGAVVALLALQKAGHCVALLNPELPQHVKLSLQALYTPRFTVTLDPIEGKVNSENSSGMDWNINIIVDAKIGDAPIHDDVSLLLSTSGSTGTPKFVKLTDANLQENAASISQVLGLTSEDIAFGHLPLQYSFGLSILTSHLLVGGCVSLTEFTLMERGFWQRFKDDGITNLSGVPWHYQTLQKMKPERLPLKQLRIFTQAGGALSQDVKSVFHDFASANDAEFFVMYGQTEASPRISTLSHESFKIAPNSVGTVLPRGELSIVDEDLQSLKVGEIGQVVYDGPNVMMGYAMKFSDLVKGDETGGRLLTGDLGFLDDAGFLTITGRADRMVKLAGLRINLDDILKVLQVHANCATLKHDEKLIVFYEVETGIITETTVEEDLKLALNNFVTLPLNLVIFKKVEALPVNDRGKIDNRALKLYLQETK